MPESLPLVPRQIAEARTLPQLLSAARAHGYDGVLESDVRKVLEHSDLDPRTRFEAAALAEAAEVEFISDLMEPGDVQGLLGQMASWQRALLVDVIRKYLLAAGPSTRPSTRRTPDDPPETINELKAWASTHHAEGLLNLPLRTLHAIADSGYDQYGMYQIAELSIGRFLGRTEKSNWIRRTLSRPREARLRESAWQFLLVESRGIEAALEAEKTAATSPPPPLADATLQQLVEKLAEGRALIRARREPGPPRVSPKVSFEHNPLTIQVRAIGRRWEPTSPTVSIDLEAWATAPLVAICRCRSERDQEILPCSHVIAAFDAAIATVRNDAGSPEVVKLAELLRQPAWARVLQSLARVRAKQQPRRPSSAEPPQLAWKVGLHYGDVDIMAVGRRALKKGGYSAGSRINWTDLVRSPEQWSPMDRRAIMALFPGGDVELPSGSGVPTSRIYRALAQLAGSPNVTCSSCQSPIVIRKERLGMTAKPVKGDAFLLVPAAGEELLSFDELMTLNEDSREGDLVLRFEQKTHTVTLIELDDDALALASVFGERPVPFPAESFGELFSQAQALQERLPIALPDSVRGEELPPLSGLVARLVPNSGGGLVAHLLATPLADGLSFVPGEGPAEVLGTVAGRRVHTRRALSDEVTRARALADRLGLHPEVESPAFTFTLDDTDVALDLLAKLQHLDDRDLTVEWPERKKPAVYQTNAKNVRMQITQGRDWFGLEGEAKVDDARIELAVLLDALRKRRRYVQVRDGMWLALSDSLREKLTPLADLASGDEKSSRLTVAGALAVEELSSELEDFEAVAGFSALLERIRKARKWEPEVPRGMKAILRDYQVAGFKWLARLSSWGAGAVLADDMGLGKTVQALALLSQRSKTGPALVIAPTSVCGNWIREVERFAPSLKATLYRDIPGPQRAARLQQLGPGDLLVASYGLLVRDAERFAEVKLATLVLDESQAIKNADTLRAKAARLIQAEFKVALTGTPLENHLGELWALYRVIFPGLFGGWDEFRDRFVRQDDAEDVRKASARAALAGLVKPFLLRRTKQEVAPELPSRTEMEEHIDLSPAERRLYEDARLAAVAKLKGMSGQPAEKQRFDVLAALTRLRLCACNPALYDDTAKIPSSKLNRFLEIVTEITAENHRALVFSQFTKHLALIRDALDEKQIPYLYLDGQTPPARRDELVAAFQSGATPVFLISLKAGGTGLNLTGADYVLHLDPWWNPAVEDQATDRAHRIGQTRPVTVVRFIARGTIEEQILSLHATKRTLVADVLAGTDAAGRVSTTELIDLIRSGAAVAADDSEPDEPEAAPVAKVLPIKKAATPADSVKTAEAPAAEKSAPLRKRDFSKIVATMRAANPPRSVVPKPPPATPEWIWGGAQAVEGLAAFRQELSASMQAGSVDQYAGEAEKFVAHAAKLVRDGQLSGGEDLDALCGRYLADIQSGVIVATKSRYAFARAMIRRLRLFVAGTGR